MKVKTQSHLGVQDLCRKLKDQLDELTQTISVDNRLSEEETNRRAQMMAKLKEQLEELSH